MIIIIIEFVTPPRGGGDYCVYVTGLHVISNHVQKAV